ncbi:MAG: hypothetical protein HZC43_08450 [Nitrosomonadales bacterium]|nr:hypothetical protein [Nitrosomonadales bacterium]
MQTRSSQFVSSNSRPAKKLEADNINRHNNAITRARVYAVDQLGARRAWREGGSITLADLALVSALAYPDLRQAGRDWRGAHPNPAAWFVRMSVRASVRFTLTGRMPRICACHVGAH